MPDSLDQYIEDVALYWEQQGLPRIAGRILALLMVCDPPYRSAGQLTEELSVSKGSVSSMTRLLLASGAIQPLARPGDRATYFQVTPEGLENKLRRRVERMTAFRVLAERGVELLADAPPERTRRLRELAGLYAFLERELPMLIDRYRAAREANDA